MRSVPVRNLSCAFIDAVRSARNRSLSSAMSQTVRPGRVGAKTERVVKPLCCRQDGGMSNDAGGYGPPPGYGTPAYGAPPAYGPPGYGPPPGYYGPPPGYAPPPPGSPGSPPPGYPP